MVEHAMRTLPTDRYSTDARDHAPISQEVLRIITEKNQRLRSHLLKRSSLSARAELRNILKLALTFTKHMLSELDQLPDRTRSNRSTPYRS